MADQLELFTDPHNVAPAEIRLIRVPKPERPYGMVQYFTRGNCDYTTPDGRWFVESNWWCGGRWCVFDRANEPDSRELRERLTRHVFDDTETDPTEQPLAPLAGIVVRTLDEAKALIAAVIA